MDFHFKVLQQGRKNILKFCEDLTLDQLNLIPNNFNNNIVWNVAHLAVTQQLLCHRLAGRPCSLPEDFIERYRKGTAPTQDISEEEWSYIKEQFIQLPIGFAKDYHKTETTDFTSYETSFGITLASLEDAIMFNNVHEGLHLGYILALRRVVR